MQASNVQLKTSGIALLSAVVLIRALGAVAKHVVAFLRDSKSICRGEAELGEKPLGKPSVVLRVSALIAILCVSGCCQPMFNDACADPCAAASCSPLTCSPHEPALPNIGSRMKTWGAKAGSHVHDNPIKRAVDAHKAHKLAKIEAKNAPPWPTFHPIPTGPVFFPENTQSMDDSSQGLLDNSVPTANYGQFGPSK